MAAARSIEIRNAHPSLRFSKPAVAAAIRTLDRHRERFQGGCPDGELSIAFLTDKALAKLHAVFLDDPTTTDVISFEGAPQLGTAGEICISADTAAAFSTANQKNLSEELTLYVVHGWLHLSGYDDLQPAKKRRMRAAESRAMKLLRASKAVPIFTFRR